MAHERLAQVLLLGVRPRWIAGLLLPIHALCADEISGLRDSAGRFVGRLDALEPVGVFSEEVPDSPSHLHPGLVVLLLVSSLDVLVDDAGEDVRLRLLGY